MINRLLFVFSLNSRFSYFDLRVRAAKHLICKMMERRVFELMNFNYVKQYSQITILSSEPFDPMSDILQNVVTGE